MNLPNPLHNVVEVACPQCGELAILLKIFIILGLLLVVARYYTKNRVLLAVVALIAAYLLFA
ncbi:MAG: hypothetical protein J7K68_00340 [Candidatus Diapherotrites archaeon]|nr:hypothetical protein [Candidatus Diapherotrites archaeon]